MGDFFSAFFLLSGFAFALVARVQIDGYLIELRSCNAAEWERLGRPIDVPWGERFIPLFFSCVRCAFGRLVVSVPARSRAARTLVTFAASMASGVISTLPWIDW